MAGLGRARGGAVRGGRGRQIIRRSPQGQEDHGCPGQAGEGCSFEFGRSAWHEVAEDGSKASNNPPSSRNKSQDQRKGGFHVTI